MSPKIKPLILDSGCHSCTGVVENLELTSGNAGNFQGSHQEAGYLKSEHFEEPSKEEAENSGTKRSDLYELTQLDNLMQEDRNDCNERCKNPFWRSRQGVILSTLCLSLILFIVMMLMILGQLGSICSCNTTKGEWSLLYFIKRCLR